MTAAIELGRTFGLLTVEQEVEPTSGKRRYACVCACGSRKVVYAYNLKSGHTSSCGCLCRQRTSKANSRHRMSKTKIYGVWQQMKQRCDKDYAPNRRWYKGQGISYDESWSDFDVFYRDMGDPPEGCSLDRIDPRGNYSKSNCRWATRREQAQNTRRNKMITHNGMTLCQSEWERVLGFSAGVIQKRMWRGWSVEKALTTKQREGSSL